jgi:hypothetical protein
MSYKDASDDDDDDNDDDGDDDDDDDGGDDCLLLAQLQTWCHLITVSLPSTLSAVDCV